ncbi:MAG: beta-ketoacyl synthase N-terminal-like domain-containing protein [Sulfurovaceae bacterium]|nr:beta-ketoacyl synthase N-terminal-like domain-containing protein [Sulfurovaceae bacterium]MDD5548502.1 beta-ketoacyl synthase N-terminal-like domain-containing protein [Sulfurovaceae bacterium]
MTGIAITRTKALYTAETSLINGNYPQYANFIPSFLDKVSTGYRYTCENMYTELFDKEETAFLKELAQKEGRNAVIIASGTSEWAGSSRLMANVEPDFTIKIPFYMLINILSGKIANKLGWTDYLTTDATACISGYKALFEAELLLRNDIADRVLVVGIDDQVNAMVIELFGMLDASLSEADEKKGLKPSSFDEVNHGFRLGHGVGYVLLENEKSLKESGNKPIAYVEKTVLGMEKLDNPFGQSPDGVGYKKVILDVLEKSNISQKDISFIKTHGTGSKSNSISESKAIRECFGEDFIATSYKSEIGHTLGANAIVELDIALKDAKNGFVRGIKNRTKEDHQFLSYDKPMDVKNILCLGSGMGNVYAASIIKVV